MHLQNTSHTLLFMPFGGVENIRTGVHPTGIYTEECQLSHKRVSHNLKCQSRKRFVIRRNDVQPRCRPGQYPLIDGISIGEGIYSTTASRSSVRPCFCKRNHSIQGSRGHSQVAFLKAFFKLLYRRVLPLPDTSLSDHHPARRSSRSALYGKALRRPACLPGYRLRRYLRPCHRCRCKPVISNRSMIPWNSSSLPIGSCTQMAFFPRRVRICSTVP